MVQLSEITHGPVIPAPTVNMQVSTCHGEVSFNILPDSGADISAAGPQFVLALGEHVDNLAPSNLCPRAVNGSILHPLGKLPHVTFCVNGKSTHDDVHIYDSIKGALVSWATAKQLGILLEYYPEPARQIHATDNTINPLPTTDQIMAEFPSVFDGQVRMMPGEQFHISLTEDARPFCVTTPRSILFAYREKLKQKSISSLTKEPSPL